MKYVVVVIFKNQMKLEKSFKTKEQAGDIAEKLSYDLECAGVCFFADTYFHAENVLCVSFYRIPKHSKATIESK